MYTRKIMASNKVLFKYLGFSELSLLAEVW